MQFLIEWSVYGFEVFEDKLSLKCQCIFFIKDLTWSKFNSICFHYKV